MKFTVAMLIVLSCAAVAALSVHAGNERQRGPGFVAERRSGPSLSLVPGVNQRIAKAEFHRASSSTTQPTTVADENIRFVTVNVFIDTRTSALAAYQFEFSAVEGHVEIVGIESGAHPAFAAKPPYYDPAALHHEHRVLIAAFSTADDLPTGKTCVARLHLAVYGDAKPRYQAVIQAAASPTGKSIIEETTISVSEGAP